MTQEGNKKVEVQIRAADQDLKGLYSNMMQATHTQEEFVLDFFNVIPPLGTLQSRVMVSPAHMKRMLLVLQENVKKYEDQFGVIAPAETRNEDFGFTTK